jgi:hypothetical protein
MYAINSQLFGIAAYGSNENKELTIRPEILI